MVQLHQQRLALVTAYNPLLIRACFVGEDRGLQPCIRAIVAPVPLSGRPERLADCQINIVLPACLDPTERVAQTRRNSAEEESAGSSKGSKATALD